MQIILQCIFKHDLKQTRRSSILHMSTQQLSDRLVLLASLIREPKALEIYITIINLSFMGPRTLWKHHRCMHSFCIASVSTQVPFIIRNSLPVSAYYLQKPNLLLVDLLSWRPVGDASTSGCYSRAEFRCFVCITYALQLQPVSRYAISSTYSSSRSLQLILLCKIPSYHCSDTLPDGFYSRLRENSTAELIFKLARHVPSNSSLSDCINTKNIQQRCAVGTICNFYNRCLLKVSTTHHSCKHFVLLSCMLFQLSIDVFCMQHCRRRPETTSTPHVELYRTFLRLNS